MAPQKKIGNRYSDLAPSKSVRSEATANQAGLTHNSHARSGSSPPTLDVEHAIGFLTAWAPDGPWDLTSIQDDKPQARRFLPGQRKEMAEWIAEHNESRSIYFSPNPLLRSPASGKARKTDVAMVVALHVDLDPAKDLNQTEDPEGWAAERARLLARLTTNLPKDIPPPTVIVDSGGGYQAFWNLTVPVEIDGDVRKAEEIERYTEHLEQAFGADNCRNVDRIMRLPGTVNRASARKRARGRMDAKSETLAWEEDRVYALSQFLQASPAAASKRPQGTSSRPEWVTAATEPVQDLSVLPAGADPSCRRIIEHGGVDPWNKKRFPSRSEALMFVCCELTRHGMQPEVIYSIVIDERWPISEVGRKNGGREAKRAIEKALAELPAPHEPAQDSVDLPERPDAADVESLVEILNEHNTWSVTPGARQVRDRMPPPWREAVFEHRPIAKAAEDIDLAFAELCEAVVTACRRAEQPIELAYACVLRVARSMEGNPEERAWASIFGAWQESVDSRPLEYKTTEKGDIVNIRHNWSAALHNNGVRVWRDLFSGRDMVDGLGKQDLGPELNDDAERHMRFLVDREIKVEPPIEKFHEMISHECWQNRRHPVIEYLVALEWDGKPRLGTLLSRYFGAEDTELHREFGRLHLCAAVKRAIDPGAKYDEVLVLEGPQGGLKSSGIRALCPRPGWFLDDLPLDADAKIIIEQTRGKLFVELAEMKGMTQSRTDKVKAMTSRQSDRARAAYGRRAEDIGRQFVFWGSTNDGEYLRDQTGNRRFWPVRVGTVDLDAIRRDRDQLWAEAMHLVRNGASIRLDPRFYEMAAEVQAERTVEDPFYARLSEILSPLDGVEHLRIPTEDLWQALEIPFDRRDSKAKDFGEACKRLKLVSKQIMVGGRRPYFRVRGDNDKAVNYRIHGGKLVRK